MKRRRDFLSAARNGRKWAAPGLVLQARQRRPGEVSGEVADHDVRVGFTVSRKVGNAVARNRARRRLRAALETLPAERIQSGLDVVVIGRRATLTRPFKALVADLSTALGKVDGLRGVAR